MNYCFNRVIKKSIIIKEKSFIIDHTHFIYLSNFAIKVSNSTYNVDILSSEFKKINSDEGCILADSEKINMNRAVFSDVLLSDSFAILRSFEDFITPSCISQSLVSFAGSKGYKMIETPTGNHFMNMLNVTNCQGVYDTCFFIRTQSNSSIGYSLIASNHASIIVTVTFNGAQNFFSESILVNNTQDVDEYGTVSCFEQSSTVQCYRISIFSKSGNFKLMAGNGHFVVTCCYISSVVFKMGFNYLTR